MSDTAANTNSGIVPQVSETTEAHNQRMEWFRNAKFGMFIHWGPCSVGKKEIGWGRQGNRPWDINQLGPCTSDPEYDHYYTEFNPEQYDADAWVRFAKKSGMKYMVLVTKHHDGFSMFDTKLSDYSIMHSPYGRDIVRPFVEACHKHGMKAGLYYSTRDWYHPDYLVGDNAKYDEWYRGQVEELLSNYGKVDIMWFDHVGGQDWGKWKFDKLFNMMYENQPGLLVNNRSAKFCGPATDDDRGPDNPEIEKMARGDYYTPEGKIGAMDIENDWESCIHVGIGWSYRGENGFKGPDDCIKMLVSCVTGGGNLLLNFGPRPDGTFARGEVDVADAMGKWLGEYGEAIYGTRGGPYKNGDWGGACHRNNKLYLHVYDNRHRRLTFDPLPYKVIAARVLNRECVEFSQNENEFSVILPDHVCDTPVTVIELTLDSKVKAREIIGGIRNVSDESSPSGKRLFDRNALDITGCRIIDLGESRLVERIVIELASAAGDCKLNMFCSETTEDWEPCYSLDSMERRTAVVSLSHFHAGIDVPGKSVRFLKLCSDCPVTLSRLSIYG